MLSIIHQQLNREPEDGDGFIVMSKGLRFVRLFSYDPRSYSMFKKRFRAGYKSIQISYSGDEKDYKEMDSNLLSKHRSVSDIHIFAYQRSEHIKGTFNMLFAVDSDFAIPLFIRR